MPRKNKKKTADITEDVGDTQCVDGAVAGQEDIRELLGGIRSEVSALRVEILAELKSSISAVKTSETERCGGFPYRHRWSCYFLGVYMLSAVER